MTNQELDIFGKIEESAKSKVDQKTRAGSFLDAVKRVLLNIAGGKVSRLIVDVSAIILERLVGVEILAKKGYEQISELEKQIQDLKEELKKIKQS